MSTNNTIEIRLGGISDDIATQLKKQGIKFDKDVVGTYQQISDGITLLFIHGYLTNKQQEVKRTKLFNTILTHVRKLNDPL